MKSFRKRNATPTTASSFSRNPSALIATANRLQYSTLASSRLETSITPSTPSDSTSFSVLAAKVETNKTDSELNEPTSTNDDDDYGTESRNKNIIEADKLNFLKRWLPELTAQPITVHLNKTEIAKVVVEHVNKLQFPIVEFDDLWNICWTDAAMSRENFKGVQYFQIVNHFPGMYAIGHKDLLASNLNKMKKLFPKSYNIFPKTWNLPNDYAAFQAYSSRYKNHMYICKPNVGARGKGIFIVPYGEKLSPFSNLVCQRYIKNPMLINGYKFDLRLYVLITSIHPLRVYVHKEGLTRLATIKYKNIKFKPGKKVAFDSYMHLTNYSVNRSSQYYNDNGENGSKRKLTAAYEILAKRGFNISELKKRIYDVIIKTILSGYDTLYQSYVDCFGERQNACFEILGFDILIDQNLKPYVLEVNQSPRFHTCGISVDMDVKNAVIMDTFSILNLNRLNPFTVLSEAEERENNKVIELKHQQLKVENPKYYRYYRSKFLRTTRKKDDQLKYELRNKGGYHCIFPPTDKKAYKKFLSPELYRKCLSKY